MRAAERFLLAHAATAGERWRTGVAWNPLSARTAQDPHPVDAALREREPVHRSRLMNAWLCARHAAAGAILRDHRRFASDPRQVRLTRRQRAMLPPGEALTMLLLDPPDQLAWCAGGRRRRSVAARPCRTAAAPRSTRGAIAGKRARRILSRKTVAGAVRQGGGTVVPTPISIDRNDFKHLPYGSVRPGPVAAPGPNGLGVRELGSGAVGHAGGRDRLSALTRAAGRGGGTFNPRRNCRETGTADSQPQDGRRRGATGRRNCCAGTYQH